jgi:hypothetical protein
MPSHRCCCRIYAATAMSSLKSFAAAASRISRTAASVNRQRCTPSSDTPVSLVWAVDWMTRHFQPLPRRAQGSSEPSKQCRLHHWRNPSKSRGASGTAAQFWAEPHAADPAACRLQQGPARGGRLSAQQVATRYGSVVRWSAARGADPAVAKQQQQRALKDPAAAEALPAPPSGLCSPS